MGAREKTEVSLEVCRECSRIGGRLGQNSIVQLAETACQNLRRSGKLRIVFAALHPKSLLDAAEDAGAAAFPHEMSIHNITRSFDILLTYGEREQSEEAGQLQEDETLAARLTWHRTADILKTADVELMYSSRSFTDFDWKTRLAETDYLFLVIDATGPLSAAEREFAELYIKKYLGASRFAVAVANSALINTPEDYQALYNRIGWFLASIGESSRSFEVGSGTLAAFLSEELAQEEQELRNMAAVQIAQVCLAETRDAVEMLLTQAQMDENKLDEIIQELEKRREKMMRLGSVAASRIYSEFTGNIQYACNQAIDSYICQIEENVVQTIRETDDLEHAAKLLPKFLASAAEQGYAQLQAYLQTRLPDLEDSVKQGMIRDAGEFFSEISIDFPIQPSVGQPVYYKGIRFTADLDGSETEKKLNFYSKALLLSAVPAVVLGYLPIAVGTVVGSQIIRRFSKEKIQSENREVLLRQVQSLCQTLQAELQEATSQWIIRLAESAQESVKKGYEQFIASVMNTLAGKKEQVLQAADMKNMIQSVMKEEIPALEKKL